MPAVNKARINFYMDKALLAKVDDFAVFMGLDRGSAFSVIVAQWSEQRQNFATARDMIAFLGSLDGKLLLQAGLNKGSEGSPDRPDGV